MRREAGSRARPLMASTKALSFSPSMPPRARVDHPYDCEAIFVSPSGQEVPVPLGWWQFTSGDARYRSMGHHPTPLRTRHVARQARPPRRPPRTVIGHVNRPRAQSRHYERLFADGHRPRADFLHSMCVIRSGFDGSGTCRSSSDRRYLAPEQGEAEVSGSPSLSMAITVSALQRFRHSAARADPGRSRCWNGRSVRHDEAGWAGPGDESAERRTGWSAPAAFRASSLAWP
jgi:hypothetical protein